MTQKTKSTTYKDKETKESKKTIETLTGKKKTKTKAGDATASPSWCEPKVNKVRFKQRPAQRVRYPIYPGR